MELDWQHKFDEINGRALHLLQTEKWADCRFLVGSTQGNQKIFAGHKLILAMASPVFERMFYGQFADKDDPIVIPDVQPDIFKSVLDYIYSDRINIRSFDKACEVYYVAKKYMLPHVVERCTMFLLSNISPTNACRVYEFAKFFDEPRLIESSMKLIVDRTQEVLADPSFIDIEMSTLMVILDQDKLSIKSELELFNALLRFADERMFRNESLPNAGQNNEQTSSESASGENGGTLLQFENIKVEPDVNVVMQGHDDSNDKNCHGERSPDVVIVGSDTSIADASANKLAFSIAKPSHAIVAANAQNLNNSLMETQHLSIDEHMLTKAVKKIRFLTMTPNQFVKGPARCKFLQQHDVLAIIMKIVSPDIKDCPMPEGFDSSRHKRNQTFCYIYDCGNSSDYSDDS